MSTPPRTVEEAVVDWMFAKAECRRLAAISFGALADVTAATETIQALENYLVEHASGESFDLGNGTSVTVAEIGRKGPKMHVRPSTISL